MFAFSQCDGTDLREETWVELFPWLDTYESAAAARLEALVPEVADWWISDSPRDTRTDVSMDSLVASLGQLVARNHRSVLFGEIAPTLDTGIGLAALHLPPRAETVVRRLGTRDFVKTLMSANVETLFTLRGTSLETVQQIAAGIVAASILADPEQGTAPDQEGDNPAVTQLVDDLRFLARWRRLRDRLDAPLIEVEIEDDAPEGVQDAASRVSAVTARDLDILVEANPIDEIENLVEQLDERECIVLRDRLMAADPVTMGELSARLHVTKSRAGTLVAAVKERFATACGFDTAAGGLLASIRTEIAPVTPLVRLLTLHPILDRAVPSLGVPLWLVLDRLDDFFEVSEGWAAAPDVHAAKGRTIVMLEQFESDNGAVALSTVARSLNLAPDEAGAWIEFCEIPIVDGHALLMTRRPEDHIAGILDAASRSLTTDEVMDHLDTYRSRGSVERILNDDDRVTRDESGRWRLRDDVPGALGEQRRFKDVRQTRRLYRIDDTWCFRISVAADHLRGASLAVPAGVATAFGCRPGTVHELPSPLGPQTLRWTAASPTSGTIRRFLTELDSRPGDVVILTCSEREGFGVRRAAAVSDTDDPLRRALALVGHPAPTDVAEDRLATVLAQVAGLPPETKPRRILSAYQSRDDAVARLLEEKWVVASR
ncbi:hypothetical protein [Gordonia rhizosphera]|uniref:RNA polymerase sigma-70 region 4 domain-containing protein n=1 Tax=Gordonia rhizosphera NBRC 16068 TaxID=1108045 RepID=K6X2T3_9ACTN|nr:hypothetical protein [Gordonia rhizosphera]GAB93114.1 hypothetical protein GORHZ_206_00180 [Gordonia rhizosphera NBRC 16068]